MLLQLLKAKGNKANPRDIAQKIVESLPENKLIEKTEIAGAGTKKNAAGRCFFNSRVNKTSVQRDEESITSGFTDLFLFDSSNRKS